MGPKRDLLRQWTDAARANGLHWGAAFHHEYTWWWYQTAFGSDATGPKAGSRTTAISRSPTAWASGGKATTRAALHRRPPRYAGLDVEFAPAKGIFTNHQDYAKWYATWWALRMMDVIENYDPDFIYTDGNSTQPFSALKSGTGMKSDAAQRVLPTTSIARSRARQGRHLRHREIQPDSARHRQHAGGPIPGDIKTDQPWIGETAVGDWFYRPGFVCDSGAVIHYLLENASRDGATAIYVSQLPDGSLDEGSRADAQGDRRVDARQRRRHLRQQGLGPPRRGRHRDGKLRVAPDGKLGRRHADFRFAPRDFRFTVGKDGALYAFCMTVPAAGAELKITSLGTDAGLLPEPIRSVRLLGSSTTLEWRQRADGLAITCPAGCRSAQRSVSG